jgi:hypothetical protein
MWMMLITNNEFCRGKKRRDQQQAIPVDAYVDRTIRCRERLGGLLKFYPREAA